MSWEEMEDRILENTKKASEKKKIYEEKFKPLYESGNYSEALGVLLKNWKMVEYLSLKEGQTMYDFFMREFEPAAKILKIQSEKMIPFENGFVPISKSDIKKIRKQINPVYARRN